MAVLSVDLACRSWSDLGVVVLEQKGALIQCDIIPWQSREAPPVVELAIRLNSLSVERNAGILMLDGPQAWKAEDNGHEHCRASERELNTAAKTGLPGTVLPGTYERFVSYCLALYDALERLGWRRLATRDTPSDSIPQKILVESYPHAAWKSLGILPLPSKRRCRVSDLATAWAALTSLIPITASLPPNHDQIQAIVGGLPGLALEQRSHLGTRIVGQPPRHEGGYWREGFIAVPVPPAKDGPLPHLHWID
ncbi:hypothetical protein ACFPT7_10030 [Acidicapsa dinghuensis]|uniref:DUF429 domain-containing protein n=1 Tax=Acidicapsa dinghuensis TaxID=2218256 RepID=A0ABW1EGZ0_9BACT|nr:hypothetical protein [Acidicapsa dinghuensis]